MSSFEMKMSPKTARVLGFLRDLGRDSLNTSFELLKVTVPAIIITKILEELGLIVYIGKALDPLMGLMGLPGELGLVWATAILTTPYGAIGVYAALGPSLSLSAADLTVLCSVMLIAHSLPVELSITKKAGAGYSPHGVTASAGGPGIRHVTPANMHQAGYLAGAGHHALPGDSGGDVTSAMG